MGYRLQNEHPLEHIYNVNKKYSDKYILLSWQRLSKEELDYLENKDY
jgi:hypothetical protein